MPGLGRRGHGPRTVPPSGAACTAPGCLALKQQARVASSAVFPNRKRPPLFLKLMIF